MLERLFNIGKHVDRGFNKLVRVPKSITGVIICAVSNVHVSTSVLTLIK